MSDLNQLHKTAVALPASTPATVADGFGNTTLVPSSPPNLLGGVATDPSVAHVRDNTVRSLLLNADPTQAGRQAPVGTLGLLGDSPWFKVGSRPQAWERLLTSKDDVSSDSAGLALLDGIQTLPVAPFTARRSHGIVSNLNSVALGAYDNEGMGGGTGGWAFFFYGDPLQDSSDSTNFNPFFGNGRGVGNFVAGSFSLAIREHSSKRYLAFRHERAANPASPLALQDIVAEIPHGPALFCAERIYHENKFCLYRNGERLGEMWIQNPHYASTFPFRVMGATNTTGGLNATTGCIGTVYAHGCFSRRLTLEEHRDLAASFGKVLPLSIRNACIHHCNYERHSGDQVPDVTNNGRNTLWNYDEGWTLPTGTYRHWLRGLPKRGSIQANTVSVPDDNTPIWLLRSTEPLLPAHAVITRIVVNNILVSFSPSNAEQNTALHNMALRRESAEGPILVFRAHHMGGDEPQQLASIPTTGINPENLSINIDYEIY